MGRNEDDARNLERLTVAKRMEVATDGRLEMALAIAGTTQKVKVDPTKHPFETTPADLFDRTFNDEQVGMDDTQMEVFKANLMILLPQIKSDIAQIPDNASLQIDQVAQFVELALQAADKGN